jgi:hypothetical protein
VTQLKEDQDQQEIITKEVLDQQVRVAKVVVETKVRQDQQDQQEIRDRQLLKVTKD